MAEVPTGLATALADRYALQRELGRGGMATVYLAEDRKHERRVALKVLKPELAAVLGAERFLREVKIAAQLTHPHILPLHDSGNADGFLYYVMPYVEGESLRDRLNREKQLPLDDALQISREVADALSYAHSHGVIHRDIKPENILLESGHAVVADFGIARAVDQASGDKLTETGLAIGTPAYMSPEQASGARALDGRSDLYSLGCVLYEMLSGETPYTGPTPQAILAKKLSEPLPHITVVREAVPASVQSALAKALARAAADRYMTAASFAQALEHEAREEPPLTAKSRWWQMAFMVVAAVAVIVGGAVLFGRRAVEDAGPATSGKPRLVVLPFVNRGASDDDAFIGGLTDIVTAELAGLSGLDVISTRAAHQYDRTSKSIGEIASELAVAYALEASVQRERPGDPVSRVRIVAQLIRAIDNATIWASTLERDSSNIFRVQGEIAAQVAERLDLALHRTDREEIRRTYTQRSDAWDAFLRGVDRARPGSSPDLAAALELFSSAIERDTTFALAYAWRSYVHNQIDWFGFAKAWAHRAAAFQDGERALALDPELGEAHWALGAYHYVYGPDYERAVRHLGEARRLRPGDGNVLWFLGLVYKRMGAWEEALTTLRHAADLDPIQAWIPWNVAQIHLWRRHYVAAQEALDRALALDPHMTAAYGLLTWLRLLRDGDVAAAREVLAQAAKQATEFRRMRLPTLLDMFDRQFDAAVESAVPDPDADTYSWDVDGLTNYMLFAMIHRERGESQTATGYWDSARVLIETRLEAMAVAPNRRGLAMARSRLAVVLAGLGRSDSAAREAASTLSLDPVAIDAVEGPYALQNVAVAYVLMGERDSALALVDRLLSMPACFSPQLLRLDPAWDPIRNDPRFQALLVKYDRPQPVR